MSSKKIIVTGFDETILYIDEVMHQYNLSWDEAVAKIKHDAEVFKQIEAELDADMNNNNDDVPTVHHDDGWATETIDGVEYTYFECPNCGCPLNGPKSYCSSCGHNGEEL